MRGRALGCADATLAVPVPLGGCYSALTRRCADLFRGTVKRLDHSPRSRGPELKQGSESGTEETNGA